MSDRAEVVVAHPSAPGRPDGTWFRFSLAACSPRFLVVYGTSCLGAGALAASDLAADDRAILAFPVVLLAAGAAVLAHRSRRLLRRLSRAVRTAAGDELQVPAGVAGQDEVTALILAVDQLHRSHLRERRQLQREISERTSELLRTNRDLDRARREAEALARTDPLTGLANRRAFDERLELAVSEARRGRSCGVILLDLDRFKSINDQHGHDVGDHVLREVAAILRGRTRRMDVVARIGGEELALLLPDAGCAETAAVAEDLRRAVEKRRPSGVLVTASFGVTALAGECLDAGIVDGESAMKRADQALYRAKSGGRNRVVAAVQAEVGAAPVSPEKLRRDRSQAVA